MNLIISLFLLQGTSKCNLQSLLNFCVLLMDKLCNQPQNFYIKFCSQPLILLNAVILRNVTSNAGDGLLSCKVIMTVLT